MNTNELIKALGRLKVETDSLVCLGCGYEHNCSVSGCAIIRAAVDFLKNEGRTPGKWIDVNEDYSAAQCSVCGEVYDAISPPEYASSELWELFCKEYRYCPKCGAKMETEEER